jgi:hypothetical protein
MKDVSEKKQTFRSGAKAYAETFFGKEFAGKGRDGIDTWHEWYRFMLRADPGDSQGALSQHRLRILAEPWPE